jgi:hypothetical protein
MKLTKNHNTWSLLLTGVLLLTIFTALDQPVIAQGMSHETVPQIVAIPLVIDVGNLPEGLSVAPGSSGPYQLQGLQFNTDTINVDLLTLSGGLEF